MGKRGPKPYPYSTKDRAELVRLAKEGEWPWIKPSMYAVLYNLSTSHVRRLCREGKIKTNPRLILRYWQIPIDTKKLV
jgi:hypothetical protein